MKIDSDITLEEAYKSIKEYKYALIYMISEIKLCKTEELKEDLKWDECLEARFFSSDKELHIFEIDGERKAVKVSDTEEDEIFEKKYLLSDKFSALGKTICVKEYLNYDKDGQVFVELTRLNSIE